MDTATSTSVETTAPAVASIRRNEPDESNPPGSPGKGHDATDGVTANGGAEKPRVYLRKYRHLAAIHSQTRPSTLSHDSTATPSFLGFRNLMIIVLSTLYLTLIRSLI